MKKQIIWIMFFCMILSACTKKGMVLDPNMPTTITIWHYYNGKQKEVFDSLVEEFNQTVGREKGIIVTAETKGEVKNLEESIIAAANKTVGAENLPDVFATYTDTAYNLYKMNLLADIGQYISEEEERDYIDSFMKEGRFGDGGLYVFPIAKSTELLYLNITDWEPFAKEQGYDISQLSTWEELARIAKSYYEWSGGKTFFGRDAIANFMIVGSYQLEKEMFISSKGGVKVWTHEGMLKKMWDNYAEPYIKGYYGAFGRFRSDDIKTGDIIAAVGSTASVAYYPKEVTLDNGEAYPIEVKVLPLPNFYGMDAGGVQQGAGMAVIHSDIQKETAAVEFLKWFTDSKQNIKFCVNTGYLPVKDEDNLFENMEQAFAEDTITEDTLAYQNTMLGIDMVLNTNLYAAPPFENGSNVRRTITYYLTERLNIYKEKYNNATSTEEKETFLKDAYKEWLEGLKRELQN